MPFDPRGFDPPQQPDDPKRPRLSGREEAILLWSLFGLAVILLLFPISLTALVDLVNYILQRPR